MHFAEDEEVGFLLLEDCTIVINNDGDGLMPPQSEWIDVAVEAPRPMGKLKVGDIVEEEKKIDLDEEPATCCQRGDLILRAMKQDAGLALSPSSTKLYLDCDPSFDGTMKDVMHSTIGCNQGRGNRSDAALMAGLGFTCQEQGFIQLQKMQVILRKKKASDSSSDSLVETTDENQHHAALLITFSISTSLLDDETDEKNRSLRRKSSSATFLPPSMQLLLSVMRSDWSNLESEVELFKKPIDPDDRLTYQLDSDGTLLRGRLSFFPSKLSLEQLYTRLRSGPQDTTNPWETELPVAAQGVVALPADILVSHIATYLHASSLDSLRCTCSYLHATLCAVVPGMKLKLYKHQIRSLCWMRKREVHETSEDDSFGSSGAAVFGGDFHRALTGGASVTLRSRGKKNPVERRIDQQSAKDFAHSPRAGVQGKSNQSFLSRKAARGGLLCDDPGLGKTITVLSLILQTMGITSKTNNEAEAEIDLSDEVIFSSYWKEEMTPTFQRPALFKLVAQLRRSDPRSYYFDHPVDQKFAHDYYDVIQNPMCFEQVHQGIRNDKYRTDFGLFVSDVELVFKNAMTYNPPEHDVHQAASRMSENFRSFLVIFKEAHVRSANKSFSNATSKPDSSIAAIVEKRTRKELIGSLVPSTGTLLVVPGNLLNHWVEQINMHVDFGYCTSKAPVVFQYRGNSKTSQTEMDELLRLCKEGTHSPLIFIDRAGTSRLPSAEFLAKFQMVLTTTQRFTNEWKHGSFGDELRRDNDHSVPAYVDPYRYQSQPISTACSLLKVYWTRLIIDEGHSMGRGKQSSAILFASWVSAQRRWAITGTPTPQTVSRSGLSNMHGLMAFLQHEFFTSRLGGDRVWQVAITRGWSEGMLAAFFRLRELLSMLMIRHTKLDIDELPPPTFTKTFTTMSNQETQAYNTLASAITSNLLICAMDGKTSGLQDSLLHRSQARHAREALRNLRLSCCGGTRVVPTLTEKYWRETMTLLTAHGVDEIKQRVVENYLHRAVTEQLSGCMLCGTQLSSLLVVPCGDLICTECMNSEDNVCPLCKKSFDVDDFQRLQPGFVYNWQWNLEQEAAKKATGAKNETESSDEADRSESVDSAGRVPLRPPVARRRTRRPGDGHDCCYDAAATDGKCTLCLEEHDGCVMISSQQAKCKVCYRMPEPCPDEESKFHYLVSKLEELHIAENRRTHVASGAASTLIGEELRTREARKLKVIVFSQFRPTLNMVGHRLLRRFGAGAVAEYWGRYRSQELVKFSKSDDCFCMLLGKDGSEGLDLSFVTHICFLEEIWDKSMEHQAVARAWRMGATGRVACETLIARHSVEEMMLELERGLNSKAGAAVAADVHASNDESIYNVGAKQDYQRSKITTILKQVRILKNQQHATARKPAATKMKRARLLENEEDSVIESKKSRVRFT